MPIHKKFCLLLATLTFAGASFAQTPDVKPEHIHGESGVIKEALFVRLEAKPSPCDFHPLPSAYSTHSPANRIGKHT
jgi:hypothetical protein